MEWMRYTAVLDEARGELTTVFLGNTFSSSNVGRSEGCSRPKMRLQVGFHLKVSKKKYHSSHESRFPSSFSPTLMAVEEVNMKDAV